jgi:HEAT repeat protein
MSPINAWAAGLATSALASMGPHAMPVLLEIYHDGNSQQKENTVRVFTNWGSNAVMAYSVLVEDLNSTNVGTADRAAQALVRIGPLAAAAIPRLTELIHDKNARLRVRAAQAIWRIGRQTNAVLPVMMSEMEHYSIVFQREHNLSKYPTKLYDHGNSIQQAAAEALGEIGPAASNAVPLLKVMLQSDSDDQKQAAADALKRIQSAP